MLLMLKRYTNFGGRSLKPPGKWVVECCKRNRKGNTFQKLTSEKSQ